ncbi:MAG: G5 domain-containing protein [Chloroflexota bacterium]
MNILRKITLALILLVSACTSTAEVQEELLVSLVADGRERAFAYTVPVTVGEFLADADITLNDLDRVNPPPFTQITNGMVVTVVRVEEVTECEEIEIPYTRRTVLNEGLAPGEERISQSGVNGIQQICNRVRIEDSTRQPPVEISRTEIEAPADEVVFVGPSGEIDPITVNGTLGYISNGNAWVIRGSSTTKRPLTTSSDLDGFVFTLDPSGDSLLYTRTRPTSGATFSNTLWLIGDVAGASPQPVQLVPENILQAHWVPGQANTLTYSTAEASETAPGWRAYNDLWQMRIDPQTGEALRIAELVEASSFGLYSWWGTRFSWSPDGEALAWVRADSLGLVDLDTGTFNTLIEYPVFNTRQSWSWRATVSWSPTAELIATTIHVPIGNYPPETSPAFSAAVVAADGAFNTPISDNSGIWSSPQFSTTAPENSLQNIAYLTARDPFNSIKGEYDLYVADRDGSNERIVFPTPQQTGGIVDQNFAWNPSGTQIAVVYQGNLWIVDIGTGATHQLTLDGGATQPVWVN